MTQFFTTLLDKIVTFTHPVQGVKVGSTGQIVGVRTEFVKTSYTQAHTVLYLTVKAWSCQIVDRVKTTEVMLKQGWE